ncbi:hypothetical protein CFC21_023213 [Triticum aestivum]|uniref:Uncharacterized protein n=3 Tax=Triticum TaxID=4564 RepID=A0A9R1PLY6_TRITD|nr:hypothetical protein CFC21_023213 [Triticum aestivum]VAH45959.1 unnamed protein product [Triticum turgidum subsp. durum]
MAAQTCGLHDHHGAASWPCRWQSPYPHRIVDPTTNHHPHLISWLPFTGSEFFWLVCKVQMCDLLYDEGIEEINFCFSSFVLVEMFKQYWSLPSIYTKGCSTTLAGYNFVDFLLPLVCAPSDPNISVAALN